ncbi:MAG: O-antigen ligase family protein [Candidatus Goldbacteria bacterium]|nr:O-antigen ligase family protein [Candidatus Goldiibacteriota bacterium]
MKKSLQDLILYCIILYGVCSAVSITLAEIFFILGIALWIIDIIKNKKNIKEQFNSSISLPLLIFLIIHILCAFFGIDKKSNIIHLKKIYIFLIFFLVANYLKSEDDIRKVINGYIAGVAFVGIYAIITTIKYRYIDGNINFRAVSFSGNHMHAGGFFMMGLITSAAMLFYTIKEKIKNYKLLIIYLITSVIIASALVFTFTRGSWLGAIIGIFLLSFIFDRKYLLGVVMLFILVGFLLKDTAIAKRFISSFKPGEKTSASERLYMWSSGINIIKDYPLGIGTDSLIKIYPKYKHKNAVEENQGHLHNNLLQIAVIDGIPGLIAFLWIFLSLWITLYRTIMSKAGFIRNVLIISFVISVSFFINGFFEYNFMSSQVALMFWFLTGMGEACIKNRLC